MPKLIVNDLVNLQNESTAVAAINTGFSAVETAMENTLSRDGTVPNSMAADLDMDSQRILNLVAAVEDTEPVRKLELDTTVTTMNATVQNALDALQVAMDSIPEIVSDLLEDLDLISDEDIAAAVEEALEDVEFVTDAELTAGINSAIETAIEDFNILTTE